jgi:hyperosmotically inducible periplasmic protein
MALFMTRSSFLIFAVTTLALFLFLVPASLHSQSPTLKPTKAEEKIPDTLSREVRHQLLMLPFYSVFDTLDFSISGNAVTLTGQVLRPTLKNHAEAAVKSLEGVRTVVNNIEVLPQSSSDDELRRDIYRAIFEDTTLARYATQAVPPLHIIVKNGAITLVGAVDDNSEIALATRQVNKVPNIVSLHNLLTVRRNDIPRK